MTAIAHNDQMPTPDYKRRVERATDKDLVIHRDNLLADLALALKYEHNSPLRAPIRAHLDIVYAEIETRKNFNS